VRAAAAVALYAIAPPAALLALIETGPGHNANCSFAESHGAPVESTDAAPPRHDDDARHVKPPQWKKPA